MFRYAVMILCVLSLVLCAAGVASAGAAGAYYVTNLGNLGIGGTSVNGYSVASVGGQLVVPGMDIGASGTTSTMQAFVWTQSGGIVNLQSLLIAKYGASACVQSSASGINAAGQVVGLYTDSSSGNHAFLYNVGSGTITNLDSYFNPGIQTVSGITSAGIIGGGYTNGMMPQANGYLADTNAGTFTGVGALNDPYGNSMAFAINESNWLAGDGQPTTGVVQACRVARQQHRLGPIAQLGRHHEPPGPCLRHQQQR